MNRQLTFYVTAGLAVIGLIGVVVVTVLAPESGADIRKFLLETLLIIGGFGGLAAIQNQQSKEIEKQGETLEAVKTQTNGTLTRKEDEITVLRTIIAERAPDALVQVDTGNITIGHKDNV